eukprot:m.170390 g.170390  ORF g.170390 m.170390 type:complete len:1854 (-) comp21223_c1_seq1:109-5670(-)
MSLKEGWLTKSGGGLFKGTKKRYFVLTSDALVYYESAGPKGEKGRISLADGVEVSAAKKPGSFTLKTPTSREFHIFAASSEEAEEWMKAIKKACAGGGGGGGEADVAHTQEKSKVVQKQPDTAKEQTASAAPAKNKEPEDKAKDKAEDKAEEVKKPAGPAFGQSEGAFAPPRPSEQRAASSTTSWQEFRATEVKRLREDTRVAKQVAELKKQQQRQPGVLKTIRVFISSTFVDEHGERDELVRRVFNELNSQFRKRYVQIVPVDLRWGVSQDEASKIQQTCLNEIDNCRPRPMDAPFFIGLRGERYGWVQDKYDPPESYVHPEYFGWLRQVCTNAPVSITSLEVYHAVLGCTRDQESVANGPHALILYRKPEFKQKVPQGMRWLFDFEYLTENAKVDAAVEHQYTRTDEYQNYKTDLDAMNAQLRESPDVAIFKEYAPTFGQAGDGSKVEKTGQLPSGKMFGVGYVGGLSDFGKAAYDFLYNQIDKEYPELPITNALDLERVQHSSLVLERCEKFLGRKPILQHLHEYVERKGEKPLLVVWGRPGCGKSALMAQFCKELQAKSNQSKSAFLLYHIVGVTAESQSLRATLQRFCEEFSLALGHTKTIPAQCDELRVLFAELLGEMGRKFSSVALVIDAVNQMHPNNNSHRLLWIPTSMPDNVSVVITTLPEENGCLQSIRTRAPAPEEFEVPLLDNEERVALVDEYLAQYHKKLTKDSKDSFLGNQMELLMSKEESGSPLFLVAAVEELRNFAVYEKMTAFLRDDLPHTVVSLFKHILTRLEEDHGQELVGVAMGLIAQSRAGLFEFEMVELLHSYPFETEPRSNFSRLYAGIKLFISTGGSGLLQFFHQQLMKVVQERYLRTSVEFNKAHRTLADYFRSKADPSGEGKWDSDYAHGFAELCYHLIELNDWAGLSDALTSLHFIAGRCRTGSGFELMSDYQIALEKGGDNMGKDVREFFRFLVANASVMVPYHDQVMSIALRYPSTSAIYAKASTSALLQPVLQVMNKPEAEAAHILLKIKTHPADDGIFVTDDCDMSLDGTKIVSSAAASRTEHVKLFDASTGAEITTVISSANGGIQKVKFTPSNKYIAATVCLDGKVHCVAFFDSETFDMMHQYAAASSEITSFDISEDENMLVLVDSYHKIFVYDLKSHKLLASNTFNGAIECRFASKSMFVLLNESIQEFDPKTLKMVKGGKTISVRNHHGRIMTSPNGQMLSYTGSPGRNSVTVIEVGSKKAVIQDDFNIMAIGSSHCFSRDGRYFAAVAFSNDAPVNVLHLYDLKSGKRLVQVESGMPRTSGIGFSANGERLVVSGGSGFCTLFSVPGLIQLGSEDSANKRETLAHTSEVLSLHYTSDFQNVLTMADDNSISTTNSRMITWDAEIGLDMEVRNCMVSESNIRAVSNNTPTRYVQVLGSGYADEDRVWKILVYSYPDHSELNKFALHEVGTQALSKVDQIFFSPDDQQLFICTGNWFDKEDSNLIMVWDIESGSKVRDMPNTGGKKEDAAAFAIFPRTSHLAMVTAKKAMVYVTDAETTQSVAVFKDTKLRSASAITAFPDGSRIVVGGYTSVNEQAAAFVVLEASTPEQAPQLVHTRAGKDVTAVQAAPDGSILAVASGAVFLLYNAETLQMISRLVELDTVSRIAISAERSAEGLVQLALGYASGMVRIVRLVEQQAQLQNDSVIQARRKELLDKIAAEKQEKATSSKPKGTVKMSNVPPGEGGNLQVEVDGKDVIPTSEKIFYKTMWCVSDGTMSPLPTFKVTVDPSLEPLSSLSACLCTIGASGDPDFTDLYIPMPMGFVLTSGQEFKFSQVSHSVNGTMTPVDKLPPAKYYLMITAMAANGNMDISSVVVNVQ